MNTCANGIINKIFTFISTTKILKLTTKFIPYIYAKKYVDQLLTPAKV